MSGSYRKIDYRIRPAKSIERKMLVEAFRRLSEFGSLEAYRYVGLGSVYFSDFNLFHRALGFSEMISIENVQDATQKARFKFNTPFKCVNIEFGSASEKLPTLTWEKRNVVWLDYDGQLTKEVLDDIAFVASKLISGSMLLVSVNVAFFASVRQDSMSGVAADNSVLDISARNPSTPLEMLIDNIGSEKVPSDYKIDKKLLAGWGLAKACQAIINNEIAEILKQRNGVLPPTAKMHYQQLFNFHYEDGARMMTTGGIIFEEAHQKQASSCAFQQLDFVRQDLDPYKIDVPNLTYKEIRELDKIIPLEQTECAVPVPPGDVAKYQRFYRYFPHFAEAEI